MIDAKYMEELFFLKYHLNLDAADVPSESRQWLIQRFIEQKHKENDSFGKEKDGN